MYRTGLLLLALLLPGCAGGPVKAYTGTDRPASETALVRCGFNLRMVAIDENKSYAGDPLTCQFALLPGKHAFRVGIEFKEPGMGQITYKQKGDQVVEYEVRAGQAYDLSAVEDSKAKGVWKILIIDQAAKNMVTLREVRLR